MSQGCLFVFSHKSQWDWSPSEELAGMGVHWGPLGIHSEALEGWPQIREKVEEGWMHPINKV